MNKEIARVLDRLKQTIEDIEDTDSSYWNVSLGTAHLSAWADQLVNDAKTVAAHLEKSNVNNNTGWHWCKDKLPEPNVPVLCYTSNGTYFVAWQREIIHGGNMPTGEYKWSRWKCPIVAWMELPEPPQK